MGVSTYKTDNDTLQDYLKVTRGDKEKDNYELNQIEQFKIESDYTLYRWRSRTAIPAGGSETVWAVVYYKEHTSSKVENKVYIHDNRDYKSKKYRSEDYDYIVMDQYQVSLEKIVSEVTDKNGVRKDIDNNRFEHRYNEYAGDEKEKDKYKVDNPVGVEIGDKVTYTIRVKNTGEYPIIIDQMYDTFTDQDNGIKLIYDKEFGIKAKYKDTDVTYDNFGWIEEDLKGSNYGEGETTPGDENDDVGDEIISPEGGTEEQVSTANNTINERTTSSSDVNRYLINFKYREPEDKSAINNPNFVFEANSDNVPLEAGDYLDIYIRFSVVINAEDIDKLSDEKKSELAELSKKLSKESNRLINKAEIVSITDDELNPVEDIDGTDNNADEDHIVTKTYAVSLEKYVSKVIRPDTSITEYARAGKAQYKNNNQNREKYDEVVTVSKGDIVIYNIKVTNDGNAPASITNIADYLPNGVKYLDTSYIGDTYCTKFEHKPSSYDETGKLNSVFDNGQTSNKQEFTESIYLEPKSSSSFEVKVEVIEPNGSNNILKNVAEIISMKNKNEIEVIDTTPDNNKDADYIQLDKIPNNKQDPKVIDYIVEKKWVDNDNEFKTRPNSIKVQLYKNNNKQGSEITLNAQNNWTYTWEKLPKEDDNGDDYVYSVVEIEVPSKYTVNYETGDNKTTIINSYNKPDEFISKTVSKKWLDNDNKEGKRPASITVQLYENHKAYGNPIKLNEGNSWTYTWERLKESNVYTIQEVKVPGYNVTYGSNENEFVIYNQIEDIPTPEDPSSPDVIIGGYVWNDKAFEKTQYNYNGILDSEEEHILEGIKVYLYREGITKAISVKHTDIKGYYSFANTDIDKSVVTEAHKQYIKGPKVEGTNRWDGPYYSYYVVFEYDGVKYTSTPNGQICEDIINSTKDYHTDSNAKEDNVKVVKDRVEFNQKFNPINNASGITYTTKNEVGYIPQSNYEYNFSMAMQSSTNLINLESLLGGKDYSKEEDLKVIYEIEDKIKYIGLGLRGRDIFDLELISDVHNVKVTVNGQQGVYNYNNKVTLRRSDMRSMLGEDMANKVSERYDNRKYIDEQNQNIRTSDIANEKYDSTGLAIEVTYKITVTNASQTDGTATKITNYYDNKYTYIGAYPTEKDAEKKTNNLPFEKSESKDPTGDDKYGYKTIETKWDVMTQSISKDIYVVYQLNEPTKTLDELLKGKEKIATYNMAEITEYTTKCAEGQSEYTRGLIDKDSAPGSVNREQVRTSDSIGVNTATKDGNPTTLEYYFAGNNLQKLKYEDDTYATPTLYFVRDDSQRTITGKIFEDDTVVDKTTKIKTGNGIIDEGEAGVYGATVELIEQVGDVIQRYETTTDEDGKYEFKGFLPGNYIIRYHYGHNNKTVLLDQGGKDINKHSFNGEDYQATNNKYNVTAEDETGKKLTSNVLNSKENFWYIYNEDDGISTGIDDKTRRGTVSDNVVAFDEAQLIELNAIRSGENSDTIKNSINAENGLISKTKMNADTPNMLLNVEKTDKPESSVEFKDYIISNMNFGLAKVPVTHIDLQKEIAELTIKDSTGQNVITKAKLEGGTLVAEQGNLATIQNEEVNGYTTQIENVKLQGARLEVTYNISSNMTVEKNFDGRNKAPITTIRGLIDIIDNNLSYNPDLNNNKTNWVPIIDDKYLGDLDGDGDVDINDYTKYQDYEIIEKREEMSKEEIDRIKLYGDFDRNGYIEVFDKTMFDERRKDLENPVTEPIKSSIGDLSKYSTIVNASKDAINDINANKTITITLEKVLSSTDSSMEDILENVDTNEYNNIIEITKLDYGNNESGEIPNKDRIRRTTDEFTILAGKQYDSTAAKTITIIPPTGGLNYVPYYIIAVIALGMLTLGVIGVRKYVLSNKK